MRDFPTPTIHNDFSATGMVNVGYLRKTSRNSSKSGNGDRNGTPTPNRRSPQFGPITPPLNSVASILRNASNRLSMKKNDHNAGERVMSDSFDELLGGDKKDQDKYLERDYQDGMLYTLDSSREIDLGTDDIPLVAVDRSNSTPEMPQFKSNASSVLKMKEIKSTPVRVKVTSPPSKVAGDTLENDNDNDTLTYDNVIGNHMHNGRPTSNSVDAASPYKLKLLSPDNPKRLSVKVVRLKPGTNSYQPRRKPMKRFGLNKMKKGMNGNGIGMGNNNKRAPPKHRVSATMPNIPFAHSIAFKDEIHQNEIENRIHDFKKEYENCEIGVFEMTDSKEGTQQKVVLIKYPKRVSCSDRPRNPKAHAVFNNYYNNDTTKTPSATTTINTIGSTTLQSSTFSTTPVPRSKSKSRTRASTNPYSSIVSQTDTPISIDVDKTNSRTQDSECKKMETVQILIYLQFKVVLR